MKSMIREYLPSLMLAGFGVSLVLIGSVLSAIRASYCPTGAISQCVDVAVQNQIDTLSFSLLIAGLIVISASVVTALLTYRRRARAARRHATPAPTES